MIDFLVDVWEQEGLYDWPNKIVSLFFFQGFWRRGDVEFVYNCSEGNNFQFFSSVCGYFSYFKSIILLHLYNSWFFGGVIHRQLSSCKRTIQLQLLQVSMISETWEPMFVVLTSHYWMMWKCTNYKKKEKKKDDRDIIGVRWVLKLGND